MTRRLRTFLLAAVLAAAPTCVYAQADARAAFDAGKQAYAAGQYDKARDQFRAASQTDPQNPEPFLWLGRASYELGAVDEAVAAWQTTLTLAPNEPYAARMLAALRGERQQADARLQFIATLLRQQLHEAALRETDQLLADKSLSEPQRAAALLHKAGAMLFVGRSAEVPAIVQQVLSLYPAHVDQPRASLLLGQANLRMGGARRAEGLEQLRKVAAQDNTDPAMIARLELATDELDQGVTAARVEALDAWIAANPQHPLLYAARTRATDAALALAAQADLPQPDAPLDPRDASALKSAAETYRLLPASEALNLTQRILAHLDARYEKQQAFAAGSAAVDALLKSPLPPSSRLLALQAAGRYRGEIALQSLGRTLAANPNAPAQPLPAPLAGTIAIYDALRREFPAQPAWKEQAGLADRVRQLGAVVDWPSKPSALKPPLAWSIAIATPVLRSSSEEAATAAANVVTAIVNEVAALKVPEARALAHAVQSDLLAALPPGRPAWEAAAWRMIDLLDASAVVEFQERNRLGEIAKNAEPTPTRQRIIELLGAIVSRRAQAAPKAVERLTAHLQPWIEQGHNAAAESAFNQLARAMPEAQQRYARLAIARLWIAQAMRDDARRLSAQLAPNRELSPTLTRALAELYALQAGLSEADPLIVEIRSASNEVLAHYTKLGYNELAEKAAAVKGQVAVPAADAHAALQLAHLKRQQAERQLQQAMKQHDAVRNVKLSDADTAAIDAYRKFLTTFPGDLHAEAGVEGIMAIARDYEQHGAFDIAAQIYRDLATFAAGTKSLAEAPPGANSIADRANFAAAGALDAKARAALARALAERAPATPPPAQLSPEFTAAINAWKAFLAARSDTPLGGMALQKTMAVSLEYARAGAWDVAAGILSDLLNAKLPLRAPERLELARALCHIGKAIPDHATEVLSALIFGRLTSEREISAVSESLAASSGGPLPATTPAAPPGIVAGAINRPPAEQPADESRQADLTALAAIAQHESRRAAQVAAMQDSFGMGGFGGGGIDGVSNRAARGQQLMQQARAVPVPPTLSDAELARIDSAFKTAYALLKEIRAKYPTTLSAEQARAEMLVMANHWRSLAQWQRSAALAQAFLADYPTDRQLPTLRLQIARDDLAWAAQPVPAAASRQAMLTEVSRRFDEARAQFARIPAELSDQKALVQQAQWDISASYLTQARVIDAFSPTLARGQFVRAAREALRIAREHAQHPNLAAIPAILGQIAQELSSRGYHEEAIIVWNDLVNYDPGSDAAREAAPRIAATYQNQLNRPLRAVEAYLELNFARGGGDLESQNAIFQIGSQLRDQRRWVEALSVLETFVDAFPRHPSAGQALTTIGQIHQANEAWQDAIVAYRRVMSEYPTGNWLKEARWSIAECTINLSQWREAMAAYEAYVAAFPKDEKLAEANRRIGVLKDLARYQTLVDEPGQRKAFDAQYQIASIIHSQLANPQKAIIEFRKVTANFPQSHLADDALHAIGGIYLGMGETDKARAALTEMATRYPDSTLADDALVLVGKSYEDEAQKLSSLTRGASVQEAQARAQREAYQFVQQQRNEFNIGSNRRVTELKKGGKNDLAEIEEANQAAARFNFLNSNVDVAIAKASQDVAALTAAQLADRQDKVNGALRKAVEAYAAASRIPGGDKAGDALLRMAVIYDEQLKDSTQALGTWKEIVNQFSGTAVAEEASWRIAQYHERQAAWSDAVEAYKAFLRNYRRSPKAGQAQFAIAEGYEHLNKWVEAMDAYTNYINSFGDGPLAQKAREQISWIKTYRL